MPRAFAPTSTAVLAALLLASCASSMSRDTEILPADARALRFGATAPDVFANPQLSEKIRLLYGPDWAPGGRNQFGAAAYFPASSSIRMVRIAQQEYIALSGCVPAECSTHRGLLLIRPDGEQLLSRLDDAGLSHYYQLAPAATAASVPQGAIDSAWFAVERVERRG